MPDNTKEPIVLTASEEKIRKANEQAFAATIEALQQSNQKAYDGLADQVQRLTGLVETMEVTEDPTINNPVELLVPTRKLETFRENNKSLAQQLKYSKTVSERRQAVYKNADATAAMLTNTETTQPVMSHIARNKLIIGGVIAASAGAGVAMGTRAIVVKVRAKRAVARNAQPKVDVPPVVMPKSSVN